MQHVVFLVSESKEQLAFFVLWLAGAGVETCPLKEQLPFLGPRGTRCAL